MSPEAVREYSSMLNFVNCSKAESLPKREIPQSTRPSLPNRVAFSVNATLLELEAALSQIKQSPKDSGVLNLIVRRPSVGKREILDEATLDVRMGLVGDT